MTEEQRVRHNKKCLALYYANKPEWQRRERNSRFKRNYKIDAIEYEKRKIDQGDLCAICNTPMGKDAVLDHNHTTGTLRRFIHRTCNKGLGLFKDNPEILRLAAAYLERHVE